MKISAQMSPGKLPTERGAAPFHGHLSTAGTGWQESGPGPGEESQEEARGT